MTKDELAPIWDAIKALESAGLHQGGSFHPINRHRAESAVNYLYDFISRNEEPEYIEIGPTGVVARKHRGNYHIVDKVKDVSIRIPLWLWNRIANEGIV